MCEDDYKTIEDPVHFKYRFYGTEMESMCHNSSDTQLNHSLWW